MRSSMVSADGTAWALRSIAADDCGRLLRWRNDASIRMHMIDDEPIPPERHAAWFARALQGGDRRVFVFEVDGEPTGVMQLTEIDERDARARWGFYLRPHAARHGSGSRMGFLALHHAFVSAGLYRIYADVLGSNAASLAMHRKLGFRDEGVQREHIVRGDRRDDLVLFGILRPEFEVARPVLEERLFG